MFADRLDAGNQLADVLEERGVSADAVLGITRGGVPVARIVADRLHCPLGAVVVQKIGTPGHEELALGAVSSDGTVWMNQELVADLGVDESVFANRRERAAAAAAEKATRYRDDNPPLDLTDKRVIVVDDGVATGATACAAVTAARNRGAREVIFAVPVGAPQSIERLSGEADEVIALETPVSFGAVGRFYEDFGQTSDEEVRAALRS